jgi:hypothetical protein
MSDDTTLGWVARLYVASKRRKKANKSYIVHIHRALEAFRPLWNEPIKELGQNNVRACILPVEKRLTASTYAFRSQIFYDFFEFARSRGYVLYNFVAVKRYKREKKLRFFTKSQLDIIFERLPAGKLRDACLIVYHTGIKTAELNKIRGVSSATRQMLLLSRSVPCPLLLFPLIDRGEVYSPQAIPGQFKKFMEGLDFTGDLSYLRNSHFVRLYISGSPRETIKRIHGTKDAKKKFEQILPAGYEPDLNFIDYI